MTGEPIQAAVSGPQHDAVPAPAWDYANGKRIVVSSTSAQTAIDAGLWLLIAEDGDLYYAIGADPTADGSAAGSRILNDGDAWAETIIGDGQKIACIYKSSGCVLWAIPAMTE